jgi:thiosulfate/3-mercaptopyruvate sulfurtransferase
MTAPLLPLLLDGAQLDSFLPQPRHSSQPLLILDTSSHESYARHHIPGAIHIPPQSLQIGTPPAPGKIPAEEQLRALFSSVGLRPEHQVVAYDDEGGGWAGRLIWTLDVLGHHRSSYLDGGIVSWVNEGYALETKVNKGIASDFEVTINRAVIAEIDDILPRLGDSDFAVWDARSVQEYTGTKALAKRNGHIPGAINIDWLELMDPQRNMRLIELQQLQQRLDQAGLSADKTIITHCHSHHRSGLSYLAMKILGYPDIKGYHGSWSEWGNRDDTPIEN